MNLQSARLNLRPLALQDAGKMAEINADPKVMAHFPDTMTRPQTEAHMQRSTRHWHDHGFGLFALEARETGQLIGFTGLTIPSYPTPASPCVEIGWRLAADAWGKGYAQEAALACLKWGFAELALDEIVSFTSISNTRSSGLMARLGMAHDPADDFDHPLLEPDSLLLRHVLYRLNRNDWRDTP